MVVLPQVDNKIPDLYEGIRKEQKIHGSLIPQEKKTYHKHHLVSQELKNKKDINLEKKMEKELKKDKTEIDVRLKPEVEHIEELPRHDIFEKKDYDTGLNQFLKELKYKSVKLEVKGSSALKNIKYPPDYDFYCYLTLDPIDELYKYISEIIEKSENNKNMWFINMSLGNYQKPKDKKVFEEKPSKEEFTKVFNKKIDYIQLEYVVKINKRFKPLTVDYYFHEKKDEKDILNDLKRGIEENVKKGKYMKALKRIFNETSILDPHSVKSVKLVKFFNSDWGKIYMDKENLKAIKTVVGKYNNRILLADAIDNIKDLGELPYVKNLDKVIDDYEKLVDLEAKKVLDTL